MNKHRLGSTSLEITRFGVGCAPLGQLRDSSATDARKASEAIRTVRLATELGINYFDTAPLYKQGQSEQFLGLGLKELAPDLRRGLCISTKVGTHLKRSKQFNRDAVLWSFEQSLIQLQSDAVEVVYIHDPEVREHMDEVLGPGGAVEALEELKGAGCIQAIGLGVRNHRFLRQAITDGRFDVILTPYDYTPIRNTASGLIGEAHAQGLGVVNASPYLYGLLSGDDPAEVAKIRSLDSDELERARRIWLWCRERDLHAGVFAMQFSLRNVEVSSTLAGPRDVMELEQNFSHATTPVSEAIFVEFDNFIATLGPPPPGGESL